MTKMKPNYDQGEMEDVIDVYSPDGDFLESMIRQKVHDEGFWHFAIHCWVFFEKDGKKFVIFQKRKKDKRLFPGKYDIAAAGHYRTGEFGKDGLRELEEELGISMAGYEVVSLGTHVCSYSDENIKNNEFCNVFACKLKKDISCIIFNEKEIDDVIYCEINDIYSCLNNKNSVCKVYSLKEKRTIEACSEEFIESYKEYFTTILSEMRKNSIIFERNEKFYSFIMLKPDAIERKLVKSVIKVFLENNYSIEMLDVIAPSDEKICEHYAEKICEEGDVYIQKAHKYFHGKTVIPIVVSHKNADIIVEVRKLIGFRDPTQADKNTIRGKWGIDSMEKADKEIRCCENLIHASDSRESFRRECLLWFGRKDSEKFF